MTTEIPFLLRYRLALVLVVNAALTALSFFLALGLRFDFEFGDFLTFERFIYPAALLISFRFITYWYWGLNRGYWRYVSARDLVGLFKAHAASSLLFAASVAMLRITGFPRSVIFIEFALSIILLGGARFAVRLLTEQFFPKLRQSSNGPARQVVVLGAGDSGHMLLRVLMSSHRLNYAPVAVLDDSDRLQGITIQGVPVVGTLEDLPSVLFRYPDVTAVINAIPSLSTAKTKEVEADCLHAGVLLKRLQSFEDIACLDGTKRPRELNIEKLLEKKIEVEHEAEISEALKGKRVFISGAGGSIGSELVRQILRFEPAAVAMFDHSEYNLFRIARELDQKGEAPETERRPILGSIVNAQRLHQTMADFKPDFVFHAAAYKHVPLMEENPYEAFNNNVLGTRNLIRASHAAQVKRFVLISTDKAVDPTSVMGASKRMAELLVQSYASKNGTGAPHMQTSVVRFGNVINSAGSVIPLFKEQILSGGPVTVTHPDMERYFMSIREAVRLVLTAGTLGESGEIFVLDMGRPIKVVDVAKKMMALYGRRDIEIKYIGMRPGEKLTERLTAEYERTEGTPFQKVNRLQCPSGGEAFLVEDFLSTLLSKQEELSPSQLSARLKQFACGTGHEEKAAEVARAEQRIATAV